MKRTALVGAALALSACNNEQADFDKGRWALAHVQQIQGKPCEISVAIEYPGKLYQAHIEGCDPAVREEKH